MYFQIKFEDNPGERGPTTCNCRVQQNNILRSLVKGNRDSLFWWKTFHVLFNVRPAIDWPALLVRAIYPISEIKPCLEPVFEKGEMKSRSIFFVVGMMIYPCIWSQAPVSESNANYNCVEWADYVHFNYN